MGEGGGTRGVHSGYVNHFVVCVSGDSLTLLRGGRDWVGWGGREQGESTLVMSINL